MTVVGLSRRVKRPGQGKKKSQSGTRGGGKLPVPADASVEQLRGLLLQYSPKNQLSSTAVRWPESNSGAKHVFLEPFYTKLIVLPRQTRDKHTGEQRAFSAGAAGLLESIRGCCGE